MELLYYEAIGKWLLSGTTDLINITELIKKVHVEYEHDQREDEGFCCSLGSHFQQINTKKKDW